MVVKCGNCGTWLEPHEVRGYAPGYGATCGDCVSGFYSNTTQGILKPVHVEVEEFLTCENCGLDAVRLYESNTIMGDGHCWGCAQKFQDATEGVEIAKRADTVVSP